MELEVLRFSGGREATLGLLFDVSDGRRFLCFTLEDERRAVKKPGETCIPCGEYRLTLRNEGAMNERYRQRYPEIHRGMLWVRDVPSFEYILIHTGNKDDHTEGCLLVGDSASQNLTEEGQVGSSRNAYRRIYPPIAAAIERGEPATIRYVDYDSAQPHPG